MAQKDAAVDVSEEKCAECVLPGGIKLAPNLTAGGPTGSYPPWHPVAKAAKSRNTGLMVLNSLTGEKVPFVPRNGNRVNWYTCGPTVYDACHMGHARAYVTMDIMRRIMEDYFNYEVFLQVNVTDIDDKIILRARRNKLVADYAASGKGIDQVKADATSAANAFEAKLLAKLKKLETPLESRREEEERKELLAQQQHKVDTFKASKAKIDSLVAAASPPTVEELVAAAAEPLAEALDESHGATVTQHEIFNAHSRKYEGEFIEDCVSLNVKLPDALTRVTEYVPQIVSFVEAIIAQGLAYESNGSVYMDIAKFRAKGHSYPKLEPSKGTATEAEMAEGEGSLHKAADGEKRGAGDFALWKKSKAGEPSWESPWGGGRPGWHIECSVMASDLMGSNMDIHAGGADLKFPHHDNELCQSEAYHGCGQWVNHFWHFGHLHIKGLKMSKSLKNFITIRQALSSFTPRQIRLLFLLQPWYKGMDFSDHTVGEVKTKESSLLAYFGEVKAVLREHWLGRPTVWGERERSLQASLLAREAAVHACLCDNFNTPGAMAELMGIVSDANSYMKGDGAKAESLDALLLKRGAMYITRMLRVFGLILQDDFGFPVGGSGGGDSYEASIAPVVTTLVSFRDQVRNAAKAGASAADLLAMCDRLRDEGMVELGVRVEDRSNEGALWKLDDPATLRKEVQEKLAARAEQTAAKLLNKLSVKSQELEKAESAAVPPAEFLKQPQFASKYSAGSFDASGKPSLDAAGEALSKAATKEVDKLLQKQQKEHEKHLKALEKAPAYLDDVRADIAARRTDAKKLLEEEEANLSEELLTKLRLEATR